MPLLIQGGHEVSAVARSAEKRALVESQGARAVQVDLFDPEPVCRAVAGHEVAINLATKIPVGMRAFLPWAWRENNRVRRYVSANLARAASQNNVGRFIQESFAHAYPDRGDEWIDESTPIAPPPHALTIAEAGERGSDVHRAGCKRSSVVAIITTWIFARFSSPP